MLEKRLQNLSYSWNTKIHVVFFCAALFSPLYALEYYHSHIPGHSVGNISSMYLCTLREHFIKHKPLISEE